MRAVGKSQANSTALLLSEPTAVIKFTTKQQGTVLLLDNEKCSTPIQLCMDEMFIAIQRSENIILKKTMEDFEYLNFML